MLVLSRKQGERLVVGDDITITVTKCGRNRVVLGIDAPKDVAIKRGELQVEAKQVETDEQPRPHEPLTGIQLDLPLPIGLEATT